jgi:transcriptional regulator with XRE-family HTH domain
MENSIFSVVEHGFSVDPEENGVWSCCRIPSPPGWSSTESAQKSERSAEEEARACAAWEHTGLSPAMLSKIERGQLFPTLPTLLRIAMVFGVGLEHFFVETSERPTIAVVRKKDRLRLPDRAREAIPSYFFESLDFPVTDRKLQAFYADFPRDQASEPHQHAGAELIYVLKGQLAVGIAGDDVVLDEGDAMYFDSGCAAQLPGRGHL